MKKDISMKQLLTEWRKNLIQEAIREEYDVIPVEGSEPIKIYEVQALSDYGEWETHYEFEYFCTKEKKYVKDDMEYAGYPQHRVEEILNAPKEDASKDKMSYEDELKLRRSMGSTSGSLKHTTPRTSPSSMHPEDDWIV